MYVESHIVSLTTDSGGDATGYTPFVTGKILEIAYTKVDFAAGVDIDVVGDASGIVYWSEDDVNATKTVRPAVAVHTTAGVEVSDVYASPAAINERIKIVVGSGGDTKTGTFRVIVG